MYRVWPEGLFCWLVGGAPHSKHARNRRWSRATAGPEPNPGGPVERSIAHPRCAASGPNKLTIKREICLEMGFVGNQSGRPACIENQLKPIRTYWTYSKLPRSLRARVNVE